MSFIKVYHGTTSNHIDSLRTGIDFSKCDKHTDFGLGFYVTKDIEQAIKFARFKCNKHNKKEQNKQQKYSSYKPKLVAATVCVYKLDLKAVQNLKTYIFDQADDNWRYFIYNNRIGEEKLSCSAGFNQSVPPRYDYVEGPLADGNMADIELVKFGLMSEEEFLLQIVPIGTQISVHSEKAKKCLQLEEVFYVK